MPRRVWIFAIVAIVVSACGVGPPRVTPTVAPTNTPLPTAVVQVVLASPTPIIRPTSTDTVTPRPTNTSIPTETPTNTLTPTVTLTGTQTPTNTATATTTATFTAVPTATDTPTITPSATNTDVPSPTPLIIDSATPSPAPSFTPTWTPPPSETTIPTNTPSNTPTPTPTFTNTPDFVATSNAELLMTRAAVSDTPVRPTFTAVPQSSPTSTLIPPTLDVTPTVITATPNTGTIPTPPPEIPTVTGDEPIINFDAPTVTATLAVFITPTPLPLEDIPATVVVQQRNTTTIIAPTFNNTTTIALSFNVGPGAFFFNGQPLSGGSGVRLFAANPADPNSFARTDANGFLTFAPIGGSETPVTTSPFYNGFTVSSADTNENFVSDISWSPNGQRLAFVVQPAGGTDNINAGVWFWDAGSNTTGTLLHDCPNDGYNSCGLTSRPVGNWQSQTVEWSPNSANVVITAFLPGEGRQGIFISGMNFVTRRPEAPLFLRWDNAQWLNNFELLVSGRSPDGGSRISVINADGSGENVIYNASANGLFIYDAAQRPNGQIVAIGREGGAFDGPYRMYRIDGGVATPISGFAGNSAPQSVKWSANYSEAVLTVNGQQIIINANSGGVSGANVSGTVQVGPGFTTNASGETVVQDPPPTGVIANSRYSAGQQIQFIGDTPRNMRIQPNTGAAWADTVAPGTFVTVLAGPYESEGYEWWQISNVNGTRAWVSTRTLDGFAFFNP